MVIKENGNNRLTKKSVLPGINRLSTVGLDNKKAEKNGSDLETFQVKKSLSLNDAVNVEVLKEETVGYNYIVDGRFDFWYEGDSQTTPVYGSDTMWQNNNTGSTKTHSKQTFTTGGKFPDNTNYPPYFSRTVVNSVVGANNYVNKAQLIEDVSRLAGKTVTLSFYAKTDSAKNIAFRSLQKFGSGGSPSTDVISNKQLISLSTNWEKKIITFTLPSILGKTIGANGLNTSFTALVFEFDLGSNVAYAGMVQQSGTFDIAMVKLEEGTIATPWAGFDIGLEGKRVSRYYNVGGIDIMMQRPDYTPIGSSGSFESEMRVNPVVTIKSTTYLTTGCLKQEDGAGSPQNGGFSTGYTNRAITMAYSNGGNANTGAHYTGTYTADARL